MNKKWVIGGIAALLVLWVVVDANDPQSKAKGDARRAIDLCWSEKDKNPGQAEFIKATCERMESSFQSRFGHRP